MLKQGKTNIKYLFIVIILAVFAGGAMFTGIELMKCPSWWPSIQQILPVEDETANWKTYKNEEYGFKIRYPEKEMPLERGGPTYEPNLFYFGDGPYEYRISLIIFDISERAKYPPPSKYTKSTEIIIGNEKGIRYEYEYESPGNWERGVYVEPHMRREVTVDVEHKGKIYIFHLNRAVGDKNTFEKFDQMLSTFRFLE